MELGVALMAGGLLLAPLTTQPWHLYLTIGAMVGAGSICLGYSGQSLFLPNWFIRRRGLAMGLAFAGVGFGSVTLLPWVQHMIEQTGWRTACTAMGILVLVVLAPINLLLRKRPQDIGLEPDGDAAQLASAKPVSNIIDPDWAAIDWTLQARAAHGAVLVAGGRKFGGLYTGSGAGSPDQISSRHRLQPERGGVGARRGQPARDSRSDPVGHIWTGSDGSGIDRQLRRLCDLLCGADRAGAVSDLAAGLLHGGGARRARLRPHLHHGRGGGGVIQGKHYGSIRYRDARALAGGVAGLALAF